MTRLKLLLTSLLAVSVMGACSFVAPAVATLADTQPYVTAHRGCR